MQLPKLTALPKSCTLTVNWGGLNTRHKIDTGQLTKAVNISFENFPYITPMKKFNEEIIETENIKGNLCALIEIKDGLYVPVKENGDIPDWSSSNMVESNDGLLKLISGNGIGSSIGFYKNNTNDSVTETIACPIEWLDCYNNIVIANGVSNGVESFTAMYNCGQLVVFKLINKKIDFLQEMNSSEAHIISEHMIYKNNRFYGAGRVGKDDSGNSIDDASVVIVSVHSQFNFTTGTTAANGWQSYSDDCSGFVGIHPYGEDVLCFKENYIYTVSGLKNPYVITQVATIGCIDERTICEINGIIYFLARDGVYRFNGSEAQNISRNVICGTIETDWSYTDSNNKEVSGKYHNCAGTDGRRYYISCKVAGDTGETESYPAKYRMYVYDTLYGLWSERSVPQYVADSYKIYHNPVMFKKFRENMYYICENNNVVYSTNPYTSTINTYDEWDGVEWEVATDFRLDGTIDIKHIEKVQILADVAPGASISVHIIYGQHEQELSDDSKVYTYTNSTVETDNPREVKLVQKRILIRPKKTAHYGYRIHIIGTGYAKLYQMEVITRGSVGQDKDEVDY